MDNIEIENILSINQLNKYLNYSHVRIFKVKGIQIIGN